VSEPRLFADERPRGALSKADHDQLYGPMALDGADLIDMTDRAGLRGRGGAAFPAATKLAAVARERGPRTVLVNAAEGEPMSAKDEVLLSLSPHLVIDGALAAAGAVDAGSVVVAVRETAADALVSMREALSERAERLPVTLTAVPDAYLSGEESALINKLGGGPLKPTLVPPRPSQRGLRRRPTLVNNAETLAHLALIARHGADWFRRAGTPADPGTALVTTAGSIQAPGVLEIHQGTPLDELLALAGGPTETLRAVLIGGYHGAWVPAAAAASITLDSSGLGPHGASLAAGVIVALGTSACPVQELAHTMDWMASQSARQCGPCSHGLPAIAGLLAAMADGRAPADAQDRLARWSSQIAGRGACRLPDGALRFLASGLRVFARELVDHQLRGPCRACAGPRVLRTAGTHHEAVA
jgi:NADH:ubiquinone oxidoreductase subunit F (NADH-binding)